ncbi:MAG: hypothetical protein BV457_08940 [Thermoplasmata archaeon M9B1D]|nr:MAG: hypothetical protein BV457_08940 [Thermoplasmata archaeon M9B1D]
MIEAPSESKAHFYADIRDKLFKSETKQKQFETLVIYFLTNYEIKTDQVTKLIWIYKEGIFQAIGEYFLEQEILNINPWYTKSDVNEIIYKISVKTYFDDFPFNKQNIVVVSNGVIDLDKLGTGDEYFFEFSSDYLTTFKIPVKYNEFSDCPIIEQFLQDVTCKDQEMYIYLLEILADILNNHYRSQVGHLLLGEGNNGKGTFIRLIKQFLGKRNYSTLSLEQLKAESFLTFKLKYSRANLVGDVNDQYIKDSGFIKNITGGDENTTDIKHVQDPPSLENIAKLLVSGQYIPKTNEDNFGWFRRFIISEWNFNANTAPNLDFKEENLHTESELSGLLNKILVCYIDFSRNNFKFGYRSKKSEDELRQEYLIKSNPVKIFVELMIEITDDDDDYIIKRDLLKIYDEFKTEFKAAKKTEIRFHKDFKKELPNIASTKKGGHNAYKGLILKGKALKYKEKIHSAINNKNIDQDKKEIKKKKEMDKYIPNSVADKILKLYYNDYEAFFEREDFYRVLQAHKKDAIDKAIEELLYEGKLHEPRPDLFSIIH